MWAIVAAVVAVALLAGSAVWLAAGTRPAGPTGDATATVTPPPTVSTPETAPVVPTSTVTATPTPKPASVREAALVKKVTGSSSKGYRITVDYIQILTGEAAADAATAAGEESPPPNDYFIVNESKTLRTFSLPKGTPVTVLGWAGADATAKKKLTVGQFMDVMPGGTNTQEERALARYHVTVKDGTTVTRIDEIFFP